MKTLRDVLIVIVLGGVVIYFVKDWIEAVNRHTVALSTVVQKASLACTGDGMTPCEFSSETSAQAYLDSKQHLDAVKRREDRERDLKKTMRVSDLLLKGETGIRAACVADELPNCKSINRHNMSTFAETIAEHELSTEETKTVR